MPHLKDLSIKTKMYGGFGAVLVLLMAVAAAGVWSGQSVFSAANRIGSGTEPRIQAAEKVRVDESTVYGYQTSYVLGDVASQRQGFTKYVGIVQGDLQTLRRLAVDPRYRAALATIVQGVNGFLTLDRQIWHDVTLGTAAAKAQAANLTLNGETTPYGSMLTGAAAYLSHAEGDQAAALATAKSDHSTGMVLTIVLAVVALVLGGGIAYLVAHAIKDSVDVILDRLRSLRDHCATDLKAGIEALAGGNLTVEVTPVTPPIDLQRADELGRLGEAVGALRDRLIATIEAYNQTRANLSELVGEVSGSAGQVSAASQEVAATSQETGKVTGEIASAVGGIAQGVERQVQAVEQAQHVAEQVGQAVNAAAQTAQQTAEAAHQARDVAQRGVGAAEQADAAMRSVSDSSQEVNAAIRELAAKSEQIGAIVETIGGIAEQTNLLALNAAIEAARAGEQGKGFAVVAEEVRKLAEGSHDAAQEIAELVTAIQHETGRAVEVVDDGARRTRDGVAVVEETRQALVEIGEAVEDMAARIEQIAEVSQQIALSTEEMQENIADVAAVAEESSASTEEVSASTEESSASAEQIAASAVELSGNAERLNALVARFKVSG